MKRRLPVATDSTSEAFLNRLFHLLGGQLAPFSPSDRTMADDPPVSKPSNGMNQAKQRDAPAQKPAPAPAPKATAAIPQTARKVVKRQYSGKKETMNGPLYMQASNNVVIVRRLKRNGDGAVKQLTRWFVENQIGMLPVCK